MIFLIGLLGCILFAASALIEFVIWPPLTPRVSTLVVALIGLVLMGCSTAAFINRTFT